MIYTSLPYYSARNLVLYIDQLYDKDERCIRGYEAVSCSAGTVAEFVARARIAFLPGSFVLLLVFTGVAALLLTGFAAPTHDMVDWEATTSRWRGWRGGRKKEEP